MKYIKNTLALMMFAAGLAACSNADDNLQEYGNYPTDGVVRISPTSAMAFSRASSAYDGETLGLCLQYGGADRYNTDFVRWDNVAGKWEASSQMLWKSATDAVDVYAYAPYQGSPSNLTSLPFAITPDQTAGTGLADLVYEAISGFVPATGLDASQSLAIDFNHALVKLTVNLSFGDEFDGNGQTVKNVKLNQTASSVTINLNTGDVALAANAQPQDIFMHATDDANKYEAVFYPSDGQQIGAKMIDVTMSDDKVYQFVVPAAGIDFKAGKAYEMNLKVGKDKMTLSNSLSIKAWETATGLVGGEAEAR